MERAIFSCPSNLTLCALPHDCTHTDERGICPEALGDGALLQRDRVSHPEGKETGMGDHDPIINAESVESHRESIVSISADQTLCKFKRLRLTSRPWQRLCLLFLQP